MKTYEVTIQITIPSTDTYTVEASSEEEAVKLAMQEVRDDYGYGFAHGSVTDDDMSVIEIEEVKS